VTGYMTEAYTPKRFFDEIRGIADGSGADYTTLYRIHMFPEVILPDVLGCGYLMTDH
jgi:hypothetical protein